MPLNFGIIGLGYWGPNYLRILNELPNTDLKYCCDMKNFDAPNNVKFTNDYNDILADTNINGIIVTTPPNTHYKIVRDCLNANKNVLVEKPLTLKSEEAEELANLAHEKNKILMTGHTYIYNPGIIKLKSIVDSHSFGNPFYGISLRLGLSPIRKSASALWDLATHDISIMNYLFGMPKSVSCFGEAHLQKDVNDFVNIILKYQKKLNISIYASWFCPEKVRKFTLVGINKMIVFDDLNKDETLKIYNNELDFDALNKSATFVDHQNIINPTSIEIPIIKKIEPLKHQVQEFVKAIETKTTPISDGMFGLNVVKVLEASEKSLKFSGKEINL